MDHDNELEGVEKLAERAEAMLLEAKNLLAALESDPPERAREIEKAVADARAALSSVSRLNFRDQACGEKAARAADSLRAAATGLEDLEKAFAARPDFGWIEEGAVFSSMENAVNALREMRGFSLHDPECPKLASDAMERLREALQNLQSVETDEPAVLSATSTIAKTLALLYPVSKIRENPPRLPSAPQKPAQPPPGMERRAAPRIEIEAEIGFQSETNFFTGFSEDISTGGIFVATYDARNVGDRLSLSFTLPDGHLISADGEVRWTREFNETTPEILPGMGIQFDSLSAEDKAAINRFVSKRQPLFFEE